MVDPAVPMNQRYTHYYEDAGAGRPKLTQLDYIFVSEALRRRITGYGFERRGIHGIDAVAAREGAEPIPPFPMSLARICQHPIIRRCGWISICRRDVRGTPRPPFAPQSGSTVD